MLTQTAVKMTLACSRVQRRHGAVQQHSRLASAVFFLFFFLLHVSPPWETWVGRWGVMNLSRQCHVGLDTGVFKYHGTVTVRVRQRSLIPHALSLWRSPCVCPCMNVWHPQKDVLLFIEKRGRWFTSYHYARTLINLTCFLHLICTHALLIHCFLIGFNLGSRLIDLFVLNSWLQEVMSGLSACRLPLHTCQYAEHASHRGTTSINY